MGCVGIVVGSLYIRKTMAVAPANALTFDASGSAWRWSLALVAYAIAMLGVFCFPLDVITDPEILRLRFGQLWGASFAWTRGGDDLLAVADILRKVMLFVPFGVLMTKSLATCFSKQPKWRLVAATATIAVTFGLVIEVLQVFLPDHTADWSGSLIYAVGAFLGSVLDVRLERFQRLSAEVAGH
jgi:hypothetical protein